MSRQKNKSKNRLSKAQLDTNKKISSLKTMYFNRFLMVRYILAVMVFANFFLAYLCWPAFTSIAAGIMLVLSIGPMWEMGKMYGHTEPAVRWTRRYYVLQLVINCGFCFLVWAAPMASVFPFFADVLAAKIIASVILAFGAVLCILCLRRLDRIQAGRDKQLARIRFFEEKYRLQI
ncbi:hypothetical protein [uncultured Faecalibaculum sp.]|uniref:hypothetical protein n=1 Tax=uncultured Faecalibaculum sp. TaxID=1729681 RepID=UPI0026054426|nr:hypothetical protein [uncultured Faecalibaculum sp.]